MLVLTILTLNAKTMYSMEVYLVKVYKIEQDLNKKGKTKTKKTLINDFPNV